MQTTAPHPPGLRAPAVAAWAAWAVALAAGSALAVWFAVDPLNALELRAMREVQSWPFPGQRLADYIRSTAGTQVVTAAGSLFAVLLWINGARREAAGLVVAMVALNILQPSIKELVDRPRPTLAQAELRGGFDSPAYPSGHVMSPTVVFGYVLLLWADRPFPGWLALLSWPVRAYTALVLAVTGLVSVWVGVHWWTDSVGGYLWGFAVVWPVAWATRYGVPMSGWLTPSNAR
jgi:undecaprenyl-diphosphatase